MSLQPPSQALHKPCMGQSYFFNMWAYTRSFSCSLALSLSLFPHPLPPSLSFSLSLPLSSLPPSPALPLPHSLSLSLSLHSLHLNMLTPLSYSIMSHVLCQIVHVIVGRQRQNFHYTQKELLVLGLVEVSIPKSRALVRGKVEAA